MKSWSGPLYRPVQLDGGLLAGKYWPGAPGNGEGRRAAFDLPPVDFPPVDEDRAWACVTVMREVGVLAPEYPGWMLKRQGAGRRPAAFEPKK